MIQCGNYRSPTVTFPQDDTMPVVGKISANEIPNHKLERRSLSSKVIATERRLSECMSYLSQGYTQNQIARMMHKRPGYINRMLERVKRRMRKAQMIDLQDHLNLRRMQYDRVISQCWEAFEVSKKNHKGEPSRPDVLYLDRILAALEAIRKMDGLDKGKEEPQNNHPDRFDWDSLTAGKQLSSITMQLGDSKTNTSLAPQPTKINILKDELDERIDELQRRAMHKENMEKEADLNNQIKAQVNSSVKVRTKGKILVIKSKPVDEIELGDE